MPRTEGPDLTRGKIKAGEEEETATASTESSAQMVDLGHRDKVKGHWNRGLDADQGS